jgi:hypothetical protein
MTLAALKRVGCAVIHFLSLIVVVMTSAKGLRIISTVQSMVA